MLTRGSGRFLRKLMSTTFSRLVTRGSLQQRGFCQTNTLQISILFLIQIPPRRFVVVCSVLGYLEEESFYVSPNGTRQAFSLIAEMLATERMSPRGFVPSAHSAFKCHGRHMSRRRICFPPLVR